MCGRYTNTLGPEQLGKTFGVDPGSQLPKPTWSIRPTDQVLAVTAPDGKPELRTLRWGLVPRSATTLKGSPKINAKLETITSVYDFRYLVADASHRALQIADGYYEWTKPEHRHAPPQPFHFIVDDGTPFAFAALWTTNDQIQAEPIDSITLLTCAPAANRTASAIHNRMPVILADPEAQQTWLDPTASIQEALAACQALPEHRLTAKAANPLLNTAKPQDDGPQLLTAPPPEETEQQLRLT
jgi:putative SOS response-associated peptidase YedK